MVKASLFKKFQNKWNSIIFNKWLEEYIEEVRKIKAKTKKIAAVKRHELNGTPQLYKSKPGCIKLNSDTVCLEDREWLELEQWSTTWLGS